MPLIVVDVEGMPSPAIAPARAFAAVLVHPDPEKRVGFCARLHGKPLGRSHIFTSGHPAKFATDFYNAPTGEPRPNTLSERVEVISAAFVREVMSSFADWIFDLHDTYKTRPVFLSDNPAFDWQHINYLFHDTIGTNPFGHSARRIGDFYAGLSNRWRSSSDWKKFRQTKHTHHPLDDAHGNVEAFIEICRRFEIEVPT